MLVSVGVSKMVKKAAKRKHSQIEEVENDVPKPLPAKRNSDEPVAKKVK